MSCRLLRREFWPHYIRSESAPGIRALQRRLVRYARALPDSLVRSQLLSWVRGSFARYSYLTDPRAIENLAARGYAQLETLQAAVENKDRKSLDRVWELAFTTYKVRNNPICRLLVTPYKASGAADRQSLAYRLNNFPAPVARTFAAYRAGQGAHEEPYFRLLHILGASELRDLVDPRKFRLDELAAYTSMGRLPPRKEANSVLRAVNKVRASAPRPVHPDAIAHIDRQLKAQSARDRGIFRLWQRFARTVYGVDDDGRPLRPLHIVDRRSAVSQALNRA